ncbi:Mut7-C RNAse domain-containing protein [Blastococcus xanthinilyticus]|uniref:Mut7-C ubiquitin/RNAse domain-containing protein n=1 Tax=Blastococcus xanthinilyticus TaxID=1564164 RepID=A0A5S5CRM1_9ACTN|nr:Mut7-C RNAse domain-containing protein [Blastococcus xanthinilyticus]TYP86537.1 hypothetical protein BD833_109142 [Blastococcus xanthinilyticus]
MGAPRDVPAPDVPGAVTVALPPALRFLLPPRDRADGMRRLRFDPDATLGHLVRAAGVPPTEIGAVRLDGQPAPLTARARPGSTVALEEVARPEPAPDGGYLLDVGLGTLARRLRLLGLDAAWSNRAEDADLVTRADEEDRVLLTQDRGLLMRRALARGALVRGAGTDDQLTDVLDRFAPELAPLTRCPACGGVVRPVPTAEVAPLLEPGTLRSHAEFSRCVSCGQVYWRGAHAGRIDALVAAARSAAGRRG